MGRSKRSPTSRIHRRTYLVVVLRLHSRQAARCFEEHTTGTSFSAACRCRSVSVGRWDLVDGSVLPIRGCAAASCIVIRAVTSPASLPVAPYVIVGVA